MVIRSVRFLPAAAAFLSAIFVVNAQTTPPISAPSVRWSGPPSSKPTAQRQARAELYSLSLPLDASRKFGFGPLSEKEKRRIIPGSSEPRVGVHRNIPETAFSAGEWVTLPDSRQIWRLQLTSPEAIGIRVHFEDFKLGAGKLFLHTGTGPDSQVVGPYTGAGLFDDGEFWSDIVFGDNVVIEYWPDRDGATQEALPFRIDKVSHLWETAAPASAAGIPLAGTQAHYAVATCHLDATCYPQFGDLARSVGRVYIEVDGGAASCSGAAINTVSRNQDDPPYFYLANHCFELPRQVRSVQVIWNYQTSTCNGAPPRLDATLPSSRAREVLVRSSWGEGDYALISLDGLPEGVYLAGWTTAVPDNGAPGVGLHHPRGSYKRISFGNRVQDRTARIDGQSAPPDLYLQYELSQGRTEPGSSGSPLFNDKGQIVGALSYGPGGIDEGDAICQVNPLTVGYGRFTVAWPALAPFLNKQGGNNPPPPPASSFRLERSVLSRTAATTCTPPEPASVFRTTDEQIAIYFSGAGTRGGVLKVDFIDPNGAVAYTLSWDPLKDDTSLCFFGAMPLANTDRANRTGNWTVRGTWNGQSIFSLSAVVQRNDPPPPAGGVLTSGTPQTFSFQPVDRPTLFDAVYQITVPENASRLEIVMNTQTAGVDLDLHVRFGAPPEVQGGKIVADFSSESDSGNERIVVSPTSNPVLRSGVYYVSIVSFTTGRASQGTIQANVTGSGGPSPNTGSTLTSGVPQGFSVPAVKNPTLFTDRIFQITVPANTTKLEVRLASTTPGADLDLWVRYNQAPTVQDGSVVADFSSESESASETITITPGSNPALRAGIYYIAVSMYSTGVAANGTLTATISTDGGSGGGPLVSGAPRGFSFPAVDSPTLFTSSVYQIVVPPNATRLDVRLNTTTPGMDMDLYVRYGQAPTVEDGNVIADLSSESDSGDEFIRIGGSVLRPGTYFIALAAYTPNKPSTGTITATVSTAAPAPTSAVRVLDADIQ